MKAVEFTSGKLLYRGMTEGEQSEVACQQAEMPEPEPTEDERMEQIEAALIELAAMLAGGDA